jgi:hypothetical protein
MNTPGQTGFRPLRANPEEHAPLVRMNSKTIYGRVLPHVKTARTGAN